LFSGVRDAQSLVFCEVVCWSKEKLKKQKMKNNDLQTTSQKTKD
jgi:hypothetical protein